MPRSNKNFIGEALSFPYRRTAQNILTGTDQQKHMRINGFTTETILEFHSKIAESLDKDDANPSPAKVYEVRTFPDWRELRDEIEAELSQRGVPFDPIVW